MTVKVEALESVLANAEPAQAGGQPAESSTVVLRAGMQDAARDDVAPVVEPSVPPTPVPQPAFTQQPAQQPAAAQLPVPQLPVQQPVPPLPVPQPMPQQPLPARALWKNPTYLGLRLFYEQVPEPSFDPLTNVRYLYRLWRQGATFGAIYAIGAFLSGIPVILLSLLGLGVLGILWTIVGVIFFIALAVAYWFLPVTALLSEWKFLVDDQGHAWQATLAYTQGALQRRQVPLDNAEVRRITLAAGESRDYLEIRRGIFAGYVSSFQQGADLYVGWTFWLKLSPGRWLVMLVMRAFHEIVQRGSDMHVTLRYESAKAMRESMHAAVHEGVYSATGIAL
jgi:hypothetical protein